MNGTWTLRCPVPLAAPSVSPPTARTSVAAQSNAHERLGRCAQQASAKNDAETPYNGAQVLAIAAGKGNEDLPYSKTVALHVRCALCMATLRPRPI